LTGTCAREIHRATGAIDLTLPDAKIRRTIMYEVKCLIDFCIATWNIRDPRRHHDMS
jgi:hypothetical protein